MVRDANLLGRFPCELSCPIKKHTLSLLLYAFKYTQYICVYVCCRSLNCLAWLYKSRLEKRKIFTVCWARVMSMRGCCYLQPKKKHEIIHRISFHVCGMQFVLSICDQKKYSHKAMLPLPEQHTDLHRLHIWNFTTNIFSHSLCRTFRINQHFICDLVRSECSSNNWKFIGFLFGQILCRTSNDWLISNGHFIGYDAIDDKWHGRRRKNMKKKNLSNQRRWTRFIRRSHIFTTARTHLPLSLTRWLKTVLICINSRAVSELKIDG